MSRADQQRFIREYLGSGAIGVTIDLQKLDIRYLGEQLCYLLPTQIDELIAGVSGEHHVSVNKKKGLRKLIPLVEKALGQRFPADTERFSAVFREQDEDGESALSTSTNERSITMKKVTKFGGKKESSKPVTSTKGLKELMKPAKKGGKKETAPSSRGAFSSEQRIELLVKENPKREGSSAYKKFALYGKNKTVGAFLKAGGTRSALRYDTEHDYIKVK